MDAALKLEEPYVELKTVKRPAVRADLDGHRLFTVDEFHRMLEAGILDIEERVELLDGEIFLMAAFGPKHVSNVISVNHFFCDYVGKDARVSPQNPVVADKLSVPQPDITLLRVHPTDYSDALPTSRDVLLVVEISDSSLSHDRGKKLRIYARNGIQEYWIINLLEGTLEVYRVPSANGYAVKKVLTRKDKIAPLAFPKKKIAVKDLLLSEKQN